METLNILEVGQGKIVNENEKRRDIKEPSQMTPLIKDVGNEQKPQSWGAM